jgi:hypothetical protein
MKDTEGAQAMIDRLFDEEKVVSTRRATDGEENAEITVTLTKVVKDGLSTTTIKRSE